MFCRFGNFRLLTVIVFLKSSIYQIKTLMKRVAESLVNFRNILFICKNYFFQGYINYSTVKILNTTIKIFCKNYSYQNVFEDHIYNLWWDILSNSYKKYFNIWIFSTVTIEISIIMDIFWKPITLFYQIFSIEKYTMIFLILQIS